MDTHTGSNCTKPSSACCKKCGTPLVVKRCRPCAAKASRESAARHPDKVKAIQDRRKAERAAKRKPLTPKEVLAQRHRDQERQRYHSDKQTIKSRVAAWKRSNPHKVAAYNAARRAAKTTAKVLWASQRYIEAWYEVARLETARKGVLCHVDHIIPLVHPLVCGLHCEDNMQVLTASDNCSKQNRFKTDWE